MKGVSVAIFILLALGSYATQQGPSSAVRKTFLTRLNHFQTQGTRYARFSYHEKMDHYRQGGPIYIYLADNSLTTWVDRGLMLDIAMEQGAALITVSHRYMGDNLPTDSASFENLQYLKVEQCLGDLAILIHIVRTSLPYSTRVIIWGFGFGATIAASARQKMPHLVDGAWSSSGSFLHDMYISESSMHTESVIKNIGGETCAHQISSAYDEMEDMISAGRGAELADILNQCFPVNVTSDLSVGLFYHGQTELFRMTFNRYHYDGLTQLCEAMNAGAETPLAAFGRWVESTYADVDCFNFDYNSRTEIMSDTEWHQPGTGSNGRSWHYYRCTQLGSWETTSPDNEIFPDRIRDTLFYNYCRDIFGENYDAALLYDSVAALNIQYGGLNPRVTNVVYTNGLMDALYPRGIIDDNVYSGSEVLNIRNSGGWADLESMSDSDSVYLSDVKQRIKELVAEWSRP